VGDGAQVVEVDAVMVSAPGELVDHQTARTLRDGMEERWIDRRLDDRCLTGLAQREKAGVDPLDDVGKQLDARRLDAPPEPLVRPGGKRFLYRIDCAVAGIPEVGQRQALAE